jgi:hypothetical protein
VLWSNNEARCDTIEANPALDVHVSAIARSRKEIIFSRAPQQELRPRLQRRKSGYI